MLTDFIETCKRNLDDKLYAGAILTDLSKAFNCLPHCLLISKLLAYGVNEKLCKLIINYLSGRLQRVKSGDDILSEWRSITKGAPQGSLMCPFVCNVFTNDLLLQVSRNGDSNIYNYADDSTVSVCDKTIHIVNSKFTEVSKTTFTVVY